MIPICDHNRVHFGADSVDFGQLRAEAAARLGGQDWASARTVFVVDSMREALGCVAHGVAEGLDFGVIERSRLSLEVERRFTENGVRLVSARDGGQIGGCKSGEALPGRITVLTSGTTGLLKLDSAHVRDAATPTIAFKTFRKIRGSCRIKSAPTPGIRWRRWGYSSKDKTSCRAISGPCQQFRRCARRASHGDLLPDADILALRLDVD